jgi:hypothetical protein
MIPTLSHIERAIRANFILSKHPTRMLETDPEKERDTRTAARMVFVGAALANGWRQQEICDYLGMTIHEYNGKLKEFREHLKEGERKYLEKVACKRTKYEQEESFDLDLRIYRKWQLINNYINSIKWTYRREFLPAARWGAR